MFQSIILCFLVLLSTYLSYINVKKLGYMILGEKMVIFKIFFSVCVLIPAIEEILFRYALKNFLLGYEYGDIINYSIFGILHMINHIDVKLPKWVVLYHVIFAGYTGYYLLQYDSIIYTIPIHIAINSIVYIGSQYTYYAKYKNTYSNDILFKNLSNIGAGYFVSKKSRDDTNIIYFQDKKTHRYVSITNDCIRVPKSKLPEDIRKSFDKYDEICKKHKIYY